MWIMNLIAEAVPLTDLAGLGTSGVMGAMWLWERRTSRQREQQLDEAHSRVMGDRVQLEELVAVVRQNAEAMTRLASTQDCLLRRLEQAKEIKGACV
jgi:hypothetical protein